jgi:putative spermidine/putrescine transport system permease protein
MTTPGQVVDRPASGRSRRRTLAVTMVVALTVAPLAVLVVRALADVWRAPALLPQSWGLRGFAYAFSATAGAGPALVTSVVVGVATTALALLLGWPAARVLGERRLARPGPAFVLLALPLLVSPYATGTGLTIWFLRLGLADSYLGLVLAHLVYVLPYVVLVLAPGFGPSIREREEAAATLGAGPLQRLVRVTVPATAPALAAAALLGFIVSFSQYGTSLAIGAGLPTLPLVLLPFVGSDPQLAAALAVLFLVPAVAVLAVSARAARA